MKMAQRLAFLSLCASGCTSVKTPCESYPSPLYKDVGMQCSGTMVTHVPRFLPNGLQMLLLTGTAISSLDNDSFHGRDLPELRTLSVTGGKMRNVGAHAFCALPALTMLYLNHNQLDKLDELSFICNNFLRIISLVHNRSLRHLPRLLSSSVEHLYLDNCSLARIDVATLEGMPALEVISLAGNRDLNCPSVKMQFKEARPDLLVICEDSSEDPSSSTSPGDEELTSEKSFTETDIAIKNIKEYTTGDQHHASEQSLTKSDGTAIAAADGQITINIICKTVLVFILIVHLLL